MAGLSVGGFIAIVIVILILNVAGVFGYYKFIEKNPDKAVSVNLDAGLVPKLRYGLVGLIFLSWIFSIACTVACTFLSVKQTSSLFISAGSPYNSVYTNEIGMGLRGIEVGGSCTTGDLGEDRINTAYAFGVINILLTTTAMIGCLVVALNKIQDAANATKTWKIMGFLMLASTWCCLFTFYAQETTACDSFEGISVDTECSLGGAGVAQVFNTMFLIAICVLFFVLPAPAADGDSAAETDGDNKDKKGEEQEQAREEPTKSKDSDEEDNDSAEEGDFVNAETEPEQ